jgi:uncharacterized membrane protein (Fun14 family)
MTGIYVIKILESNNSLCGVIEIEHSQLIRLVFGIGSIVIGLVCMFISLLRIIGPFFIGFGLGYTASVIKHLKFNKEERSIE